MLFLLCHIKEVHLKMNGNLRHRNKMKKKKILIKKKKKKKLNNCSEESPQWRVKLLTKNLLIQHKFKEVTELVNKCQDNNKINNLKNKWIYLILTLWEVPINNNHNKIQENLNQLY